MSKSQRMIQKSKSTLPEIATANEKISRRAQKQLKQRDKESKLKWEFPLEVKNMYVLGIGLAIIIVGYLLMATGMTEEPAIPDGKWNNPFAIVIAPILLVFGYLVVIPYGLWKVFTNQDKSIVKKDEQQGAENAG